VQDAMPEVNAIYPDRRNAFGNFDWFDLPD